MIKHVLMVKLKDNSEQSCKEAVGVFKSMVGNVPCVIDLQAGADFLHSDRSYDIILEVTLKDKAALEEYQNDKFHIENVKSYMHTHRSASVAVDYEI